MEISSKFSGLLRNIGTLLKKSNTFWRKLEVWFELLRFHFLAEIQEETVLVDTNSWFLQILLKFLDKSRLTVAIMEFLFSLYLLRTKLVNRVECYEQQDLFTKVDIFGKQRQNSNRANWLKTEKLVKKIQGYYITGRSNCQYQQSLLKRKCNEV